MKTIIVNTDFSASSKNALSYACAFANEHHYSLLLLHIYTFPATYSGDGIALVSVMDALNSAGERLEEELSSAREQYPQVDIKTRALTGSFLTALQEQVAEEKPEMVIIGSSGKMEDLWSWSVNILNALTYLSVPVLTIPQTATYTPIQSIALACNYNRINTHTPFDTIRKMVAFTCARLSIVHVSAQETEKEPSWKQGEQLVHERLQDTGAKFYTIQNVNVIEAIGRFSEQEKIDCLLVIPKKHSSWESIFHKSHTKQLARLNTIPVMALPEH